ncbi:hypothetical protein BDA99DRAFT_541999 [Phascolomyces articulosus]|uniref:Uncharacterized protein n=1 Tax=Phascolomyces articulosus TaxID=60185 RepID=A0AAD5P985_9FUNG|nr:hypothetical protein BDA99DRAFT_541999 [Phascolomyces articulosus]
MHRLAIFHIVYVTIFASFLYHYATSLLIFTETSLEWNRLLPKVLLRNIVTERFKPEFKKFLLKKGILRNCECNFIKHRSLCLISIGPTKQLSSQLGHINDNS